VPLRARVDLSKQILSAMRKIESAMIAAIREAIADPYTDGQQFKKGNTIVFCNGSGVVGTPNFSRWIEVIFHNTVIALIEPQTGRLSLYSGGFRTATTKSRLNAILSSLSNNLYIAQKNGEWYIGKGGYRCDSFSEGYPVTLWLA
jgi:hypothetical protein